MLIVRNLWSGYGSLRAVRGASFHVREGEIVALIGANGAGKTTLLKTLAGLIAASGGEVLLSQRNLCNLSPWQLVREGVSLVPEGRALFATLTVEENIRLGAYYRRSRSLRSAVQQDLDYVRELFPILVERSGQLAGTLSGGEQQMVAVARGLMSRPRLLMLDEPSMGLAPVIARGIFAKLRQLRDDGLTVLLVEQNAVAALDVADRGYVLETGQILMVGESHDLLNNHEVRRAYLGKAYREVWE